MNLIWALKLENILIVDLKKIIRGFVSNPIIHFKYKSKNLHAIIISILDDNYYYSLNIKYNNTTDKLI